MRSALMFASLAVAAAACDKPVDPKVTAAWQRACHAQESVMQNGTPDQYNAKIVTWINAHSHNDSVNATFAKAQALSSVDDKAKLIRTEADKSGVHECPVVDAMWPTAKK